MFNRRFNIIFLIFLTNSIVARSINSSSSPKEYVDALFKFFGVSREPEMSFYCPVKHGTTYVENLCYYTTFARRTRANAKENCFKKSHRLAEIDTNQTWNALIYYLNKEENQINDILGMKLFHLGTLKVKHSNKLNFSKYIWNHSETELIQQILCSSSFVYFNESPSLSRIKCVELLVNYVSTSNSSANTVIKDKCLRIVECNRTSIYSICEWRGDNIEDFSVYLLDQLIEAYYAIVVVFLLYIIIWYIFYLIYKYRSKDQLRKISKAYKYELKISNLDVTNIKVMH